MAKKNTGRENSEFGKLLILKVKDVALFVAKRNPCFSKDGYACQVSFGHVIVANNMYWHGGNLRSDRENREIQNTM